MLSPASAGLFLCRGVVERCKSRPVNCVRTSTSQPRPKLSVKVARRPFE